MCAAARRCPGAMGRQDRAFLLRRHVHARFLQAREPCLVVLPRYNHVTDLGVTCVQFQVWRTQGGRDREAARCSVGLWAAAC